MVDLYLQPGQKLEVRGQDYQYIVSGLNKAIFPYDFTVYHGVEYQEDEFWDQLSPFIKNLNGNYDYSETKGKIIESYGFFSTTLQKNEAIEYCNGWNWENEETHLPLKEKAVFIINIPKGYNGAAYLADFDFAGTINQDDQVLINKNCKFQITNVFREKDINFFEMNLLNN